MLRNRWKHTLVLSLLKHSSWDRKDKKLSVDVFSRFINNKPQVMPGPWGKGRDWCHCQRLQKCRVLLLPHPNFKSQQKPEGPGRVTGNDRRLDQVMLHRWLSLGVWVSCLYSSSGSSKHFSVFSKESRSRLLLKGVASLNSLRALWTLLLPVVMTSRDRLFWNCAECYIILYNNVKELDPVSRK